MRYLTMFALLTGCSNDPQPNSGDSKLSPAPVKEAPVTKAPEKEAPPEKKSDAIKKTPPDPLKGKSTAQICSSDSLAMIKWSFDELQANFNKLCCGSDGLKGEAVCDWDWPFNDVPTCDNYDHMRNGIYALYGYPFKGEKWKKIFSQEKWYTVRDDFEPGWMSKVASANIKKLKQLKKDKVGCMD